tara:strand:+ start:82 stop:642 length:561 start_codon:yes stop_codon:yes gene_type:complete
MKFKLKNYNCVTSTNDQAIRLIKRKIFSPRIIYANTQTKGRGTMGKKWISKKGNLFLSIFFEIKSEKFNAKKFIKINTILLKEIFEKYTEDKILIKFPNDILIKKRKLCGVLQEIIELNSRKFLIIGIGINTIYAPKSKNFRSISLSSCSKFKITNQKILKEIKSSYEKFVNNLYKDIYPNFNNII